MTCYTTNRKLMHQLLRSAVLSPSAVPSSRRPRGLQPARPLCKGFPGKSPGARCHGLLTTSAPPSQPEVKVQVASSSFSLCTSCSLHTQQLCLRDSQFFFCFPNKLNLNFWWSTEHFNVHTDNSILGEHFFINFLLKIVGHTSKKGIMGNSFQMKL